MLTLPAPAAEAGQELANAHRLTPLGSRLDWGTMLASYRSYTYIERYVFLYGKEQW